MSGADPVVSRPYPARFKVYTKTGDEGTSSLYNGKRRPKDDVLFAALGDVDELNASIGLAREYCSAGAVGIESQLVEIQSRLLDVGSSIATPASTSTAAQLVRVTFPSGMAAKLETWIDEFDEELPTLTNFILPSGGLAASALHVSRTICRRAERQAFALVRDGEITSDVAVFLNRLSDYLFMAARVAAKRVGAEEVVYKKGREEAKAVPN